MAAAIAVLFLLMFVEYVACSRRRSSTCTCICAHGRFRWDAADFGWQGFGGAGEDGDTAYESRAACNCDPVMWSMEEEESHAIQSRACRETDFHAREDNATVKSRSAHNYHQATPGLEEESTGRYVKIRTWSEINFHTVEDNITDENHATCKSSTEDSTTTVVRLKSPEISAANFVSLQECSAADQSRERKSPRSATNSVSSLCIACSSNNNNGDNSCISMLPADSRTVVVVSTRADRSNDDDTDSSVTEQQLAARQQPNSNGEMDVYDYDNMESSSSTTEQADSLDNDVMVVYGGNSSSETLMEHQPVNQAYSDYDGDIDVGMTPENPANGNDHDNTRSVVPWWLLPGIKFLPTDLEIVVHYLKHKVLNLGLPAYHPVVDGIDIYALDGDQIRLDDNNRVDGEVLGFFFVLKERKRAYSNGCFRATPDGYWKVRGRAARVKDDGGRTIAFKTSMHYYRGRPPHGCRTRWSMTEYSLNADRHAHLRNLLQPWMNSYVVCKVRKRERASDRANKLTGLLLRSLRIRRRIQNDQAVKPRKAAARQQVGEVPATLGKRKHSDLF